MITSRSSRAATRFHGELPAWLKPRTRAALCFSIDDVHPAADADVPGVGAVAHEAISLIAWLLDRHPQLRLTCFTTPDWRTRGVHPTGVLHRIPGLRRAIHPIPVWPQGTLRLDRHPSFIALLRKLPRTDFAPHGLHHVKRGANHLAEFSGRSRSRCRQLLEDAMAIMTAAGLPVTRGTAPPLWHAPDPLLEALAELEFSFVASARDLHTPIAPDARTAGSGRRGTWLIHPERLPFGSLVHLPTNFQGPSPLQRAIDIIEAGGLVSVKLHFLKRLGTYEALDGIDRPMVEYLDRVFSTIEDRYGDSVWWTTMAEVAEACRAPAKETVR